ncbi:MAG TPA: serine protease [Flavobacteriales bacterium]|nr:serine protease [Flavobacteriales bacterium]
MATLLWNNNLLNLRDILADLYWDKAEARALVQEAKINPAFISFKDSAINNWHYILDYARHDSSSVDAIIDVAIGRALPDKKQLLLMAKQHTLNLRGIDITKDVAWQRSLDPDQLEKITGKQSTLLPITFLDIGLTCAKAVARLDLGERGLGSGFLIDNDLLLTNHHVLEDKGQAQDAKAQFNYQQTLSGLSEPSDEYELDPKNLFYTSLENDWTVVKVKSKEGKTAGQKWSTLKLSEQDPKVDDFTIIIQHPSGGPKQIALYHNIIAYIDANKQIVQYLTDTEPGSSGSPVFDTHWNVIALHHSGGWLREPGNDPKQKFYRNEGIHINNVIAGLKSAGIIQ